MKALVTGAAGFIGSFLVPALLRQGMEVSALVLPGEDVKGLTKMGVQASFGDLTEPESIEGLCDGVDIIFHLAGRVTDWGKRWEFYSSILDATRNLLEESAGRGCRFLYASSVCALGTGRNLAGLTEEDPARKTGVPYGDAKLDAEDLVWDYHNRGDVVATVVRPTNVIGPGSVWVRDVVERFQKSSVPLIDGGRHSASLIYVDNLVEGMLKAGTMQAAEGVAYHFRDDWQVTWKEYLTDLGAMVDKEPSFSAPFRLAWYTGWFFEKLLTPLGVRPPFTRHTVGIMGRDLDIDNSRAKEELGWSTRISYEDAMRRIGEWVIEGMV